MSPALIAALPFLGALLPGLLIRSGRNVAACACATASALALIGLCLHIPTVLAGGGNVKQMTMRLGDVRLSC